MPPHLPFKLWHLLGPLALGLAAVYLLLPRPRRYPTWLGTLLGVAALASAGALLLRAEVVTPDVVLFYGFSAIAVVGGVLLVTQRNPVHGALSFAVVVLSTCGLFLLQAAPFLMAATTIVYAGAIVVTFLFVIMLAQQEGPSDADQRSREPLLSTVAGALLLAALLYILGLNYGGGDLEPLLARAERAAGQQTAGEIAQALAPEGEFFERLAAAAPTTPVAAGRRPLDVEVVRVRERWDEWKDRGDAAAMRQALGDLVREARAQVVDARGSLPPRAPAAPALSDFSGPSVPAAARPRDPEDPRRARMPGENTAYLGRALFTDYLLPVELAGTLLLVATIGAIAISGRRTEGVLR